MMIGYTEPWFDVDYKRLRDLAKDNFSVIQRIANTSSKKSRVSKREKITVTFIGTGLGRYEAILGSRATAGVLISYYPKNKPPYDMLMDPGCRVQERLRELGYNLADTDVVLFTHAHYDHFQQKDQILEGATGAALKRGKITIVSNATCLDGSPGGKEIPEITEYQRTFGTVLKLDPHELGSRHETTLQHGIRVRAHRSMHAEVKGARKVNSYTFDFPTEDGHFKYGNISEGPVFKEEDGEWIKDEEGRLRLNESLFEPFVPCDLVSVEVGPFTCTGHELWENHCGYEGAEAILSYLLKRNSPLDVYVEKEWGYEVTNILDDRTRKYFETFPLETFSEASAYKAYDTARKLGRRDVMVIDAIDKTQVVYFPDVGEYKIRVPVEGVNDARSILRRKVFPTPLFPVSVEKDTLEDAIVKEGETKFVEFTWKK